MSNYSEGSKYSYNLDNSNTLSYSKDFKYSNNFQPWLKDRLTEKRYIHSLAVQERAVVLAKIHGSDEAKAALAGLLHDCCHCLSTDEQLKIITSRGILLDDFTIALPALWHAIAGSIAISAELNISDAEIISAVRYHTTGRSGMTKLEQIVYIADLTSGDRDYQDVDTYRALSEKSLSACMQKSLGYTIKTLVKRELPIVKDAHEAYNYFWQINDVT